MRQYATSFRPDALFGDNLLLMSDVGTGAFACQRAAGARLAPQLSAPRPENEHHRSVTKVNSLLFS